MQNVHQQNSERGDELDLIGLWKVLVEYKLLIIVFTTLTTLGAAYYASTLPTVYKAQVLMVNKQNQTQLPGLFGGVKKIIGGGSGSGFAGIDGEQALVKLKTRSFLVKHIRDKNLKPVLFSSQWDSKEKRWIDKEPSDDEAFDLFHSMISAASNAESKANIIPLTITWENPGDGLHKIAEIANSLVKSLNLNMSELEIKSAKVNIVFLKNELNRMDIIDFQKVIYGLIKEQIKRIMIANITEEFVFKILEPAIVPLQPEKNNKIRVILFGTVLGLLLGMFVSFVLNYFKTNIKLGSR